MLQPVAFQFNILPSDDGQWRWEIVTLPSGKVAGVCGETYATIDAALRAILRIGELSHVPIAEPLSGTLFRGPSEEMPMTQKEEADETRSA